MTSYRQSDNSMRCKEVRPALSSTSELPNCCSKLLSAARKEGCWKEGWSFLLSHQTTAFTEVSFHSSLGTQFCTEKLDPKSLKTNIRYIPKFQALTNPMNFVACFRYSSTAFKVLSNVLLPTHNVVSSHQLKIMELAEDT